MRKTRGCSHSEILSDSKTATSEGGTLSAQHRLDSATPEHTPFPNSTLCNNAAGAGTLETENWESYTFCGVGL